MATERSKEVAALLAQVTEAYDHLEMPAGRYLLVVIVPSVALFVLSLVALVALPFPLMVRLPMPVLGLIGVVGAVAYPKIIVNQRQADMENRLHLLITHMTILSTTNIDRMEVFRRLADEDEYGALADEIGRITQLVDTWNQSLDDGLRRRAKQVPSKPVSNLFERLAYTLGAGQQLSDFLLNEQSVIMENYSTSYEGSLDNLEVMQDLYLSMILSMTFALVFATVLPVLTGTDPTMTVGAVIVMFAFVQSGFYLTVRTMAPYDPVWYHPVGLEAPNERRVLGSIAAGGGIAVLAILVAIARTMGWLPPLFAAAVPGMSDLPTAIKMALPVTPLLIPGIVLRNEEQKIKERDEEFPSFIRALGASESAKQSTTSAVLENLRTKDFGALTANIDDLYKRLNMRIDSTQSWRLFAVETRSYLVQKFSEMYLAGRQMGGEPRQLGELISENMNEVNQLRQRRKQSTVTLIGLLYGITAAASFAFFIGLKVVEILADLSLGLESTEQFDFTQLIYAGVYDIPLIEFLLLLVILLNALLSSLMIRAVDGGHKANAYIHFVALTWIGCVISVVTKWLVGVFIGV